MSTFRSAMAAAITFLGVGCVNHYHPAHPHGMPPGQAKKVVHMHAHDCGHVLIDGVWVVVSSEGHPGQGNKKKH